MSQTVVGVFDDHASAQSAAAKLKASGFSADAVHISMSEASGKSTSSGSVSTTTSTTESGGVVASVKNFFSDIFGNDDDERVGEYTEAVRRGGVLVKVDVDEDDEASIDLARDTLEDAGAMDIEERAAEWRQSGWTGSTTAATSSAAALQQPVVGSTTSGDETIKVVKEEVAVGKRTVGTGGVRVYARTVERPVTESLQLREEHATIQRTAVDRPATAADLQAFQDRTIEVRETAEEAVVQKTARVVEEVTVGKESSQRTETIHETVRETEVEVESLPGASRLQGDDSVYRSHYASEYGSLGGTYDEYEPAYQYGQSLYGDPRYANKSWDEFEPHARSDWETKYPGGTWDRVKGAVRHAWQSGKQKLS